MLPPEEHAKRLWKLLAFAGRYGNQSIHETRKLPVSELTSLTEALATLIEEEAEAREKASK